MPRPEAILAVVAYLSVGCGAGSNDDLFFDPPYDGGGGTAGTGGAAGSSGHGGRGGGGGAGNAPCFDSDGFDPEVRGTTTGVQGKLRDACTEAGNLIEHSCEVLYDECAPNHGPPPQDPPCQPTVTGNVLSTELDCGGACTDGTCYARCPDFGDALVFVELGSNGSAVLRNEADDRRYGCTLIWDNPKDAYDCEAWPRAGTRVTISALGLSSGWCTGGAFGNIGTDDPAGPQSQECSYSCEVLQP